MRRVATIVIALVLAPALLHAAPPDDAVAVVRRSLDAALAIAGTGKTRDEQLAALHATAREFLDTQTLGRRAIGDVLAAQPPAQQKEYLDLFDTLIVRAYLQKLLLFRSPRFLYGDPRRAGDDVIVPTRIATSKDEYRVDYDMRNRDGRWMAIDVLVEDISLTDNYRSQFAALMRDRSFAELLAVMRAKVGTGRAEPAS